MGLKIAVVGAGISGLSLAYRLKKEGNDVTVFESAGKVGGKIGTVYCEGLELDLGPISIAETPELVSLASELDLEIIEADPEATKIRYIYSKGKLHKASPLSSLLSFGGKLSMLKALFTSKGDKDESVASYATRRFGKQAYQRLFNPLMNGIYAGNAELLSAKSVIKNRGQRKIVSLKGGIASLTNALASKIEVKLNSSLENFDAYDEVYLAAPASVTAQFIKDLDPKLSDKLSNIRYSSLSQIFIETVPGRVKFDGFGFLVPSEEKLSLLGAVCISNIFPSKVAEGRRLFVLFCGGDRPYDFKASIEDAVNEFKEILKPAIAKVIHVQEYIYGIPQPYVGHSEILQSVSQFEIQNSKFKIRGNYISGVAVGDCL